MRTPTSGLRRSAPLTRATIPDNYMYMGGSGRPPIPPASGPLAEPSFRSSADGHAPTNGSPIRLGGLRRPDRASGLAVHRGGDFTDPMHQRGELFRLQRLGNVGERLLRLRVNLDDQTVRARLDARAGH